MKNIYNSITFFCFLFFSISYGQVGIGVSAPDKSAILEVNATAKKGGVLLPNVPLTGITDNTTILSPAKGLMVYNTQNSGVSPNNVEADNIYLWDGTKWKNISDIETVKKTLLPPVFFAQTTQSQDFTGTELTKLNNGTGSQVLFPNNTVVVNNGGHITLNNNQFIVNTAGQYEISAAIAYFPAVSGSETTNLEFRIERSNDSGSTWSTIASVREVYGQQLGSFYRTAYMPPSIIQNINVGDRFRLLISRPDNYGSEHGSSGSIANISVGQGIPFSKNIKILKLN